jgi:hypothetical protein
MTDTSEARVAPAAESAELTEHVNVLVTPEVRAFLLGSKIADDARSEGAVARALLERAIYASKTVHAREYARRVELGRQELARRAAKAATRVG